jgi:hypothetical protein
MALMVIYDRLYISQKGRFFIVGLDMETTLRLQNDLILRNGIESIKFDDYAGKILFCAEIRRCMRPAIVISDLGENLILHLNKLLCELGFPLALNANIQFNDKGIDIQDVVSTIVPENTLNNNDFTLSITREDIYFIWEISFKFERNRLDIEQILDQVLGDI